MLYVRVFYEYMSIVVTKPLCNRNAQLCLWIQFQKRLPYDIISPKMITIGLHKNLKKVIDINVYFTLKCLTYLTLEIILSCVRINNLPSSYAIHVFLMYSGNSVIKTSCGNSEADVSFIVFSSNSFFHSGNKKECVIYIMVSTST